MAALPLPWWGSQIGEQERCPIKPSLLRVPKVARNQNELQNQGLIRSQSGEEAGGCTTAAFPGSPRWGGIQVAASPLPSWGPQHGEESKWIHNRGLLGVPKEGRKLIASPLPSRRPIGWGEISLVV